MKFIYKYLLLSISALFILAGCSDSPTETSDFQAGTLIYEKPNLVDSLVGTCSAYLIRTSILDSLDTRDYNKLRIEFNAYTDGDLSNIGVFYTNSNTNFYLFELNGISQINNTNSITITSPKIKDVFYLRLRLFSSVCTGQYYHLKIRNLKIYLVN